MKKKKAIRTTGLRELKNALPLVLRFMNNPTFVEMAKDLGYEFDVVAVYKAVMEASGWKSAVPLLRKIVPSSPN